MFSEQNPDTPPQSLQLRIEPELPAVRAAVERVAAFLDQAGCLPQEVSDSRLALVEACNNLILHGRNGDRLHPFKLEATCKPAEVCFQILDQSKGFEWPAQVHLPDSSSETGRGIFLIQAVMDSVQYTRSPEGNRLLLRKFRAAVL